MALTTSDLCALRRDDRPRLLADPDGVRAAPAGAPPTRDGMWVIISLMAGRADQTKEMACA